MGLSLIKLRIRIRLGPYCISSALDQAREGLGGRDIEEPLIGLAVQKSTLEQVTAVHHLRNYTCCTAKLILQARSPPPCRRAV